MLRLDFEMAMSSKRQLFPMAILLSMMLAALGAPSADAQDFVPLRALDSPDAITYFIADGNAGSGYRPADSELARWALETWQRTIGKSIRFQAAPESSARVRVYWTEPNEGQYGEMRPLTIGGKRGADVFIQTDVELLGPDIARLAKSDDLLRDSIVYLTCLHELGHALGLMHTMDFRDIMYYFGYGGDVVQFFTRYRAQLHSRSDIASVSGLSDADISRIRAIYSGK